jgi:hypothetical protein
VIMIGGLRRFATNAFGVSAATICPTVTEKNYRYSEGNGNTTSTRTMRNWYPARSELRLNPEGK